VAQCASNGLIRRREASINDLGGERVVRRKARRRHPRQVLEPVVPDVKVAVDHGVAAYVVYTATITFSTRPIVPEYCPARSRRHHPLLRLPRLVKDQDPVFVMRHNVDDSASDNDLRLEY
jgi:hypothetical protein